jgi:pimeloyl-ACP methyl ester carboxylesterase
MSETATFRAGSGDPLVLLHIGANPWKKWENVMPALTARYDVFMPTYAGFEGGPPLPGPATIDTLTNAVESEMDAAGIGRAHVVGNSLGGWIAMELARRGRARSAIALSPAGGWPTRRGQLKVRLFFRFNRALDWAAGPLKPWALRVPFVRKLVLRGVIEHGDRVTPSQALALSTDSMRGTWRNFNRFLNISREVVQSYPELDVPTMVVWCEKDRLTPLHPDGDVWRDAAPQAQWRVIPGAGHLPMFDAAAETTELVLDWLEKAT